MSDLEKEELFSEITEHLDTIEEIVDNFDYEDNEELIVISDLIGQLRKIVLGNE